MHFADTIFKATLQFNVHFNCKVVTLEPMTRSLP